jgi:GNAT superfamily N-acetyltransferase
MTTHLVQQMTYRAACQQRCLSVLHFKCTWLLRQHSVENCIQCNHRLSRHTRIVELPLVCRLLQAMPESSLPIIRAAGRQLYEAGTAAMSAAGHTSYLKLFLVATRPEAQGSGLGSAVLDAVVAAADRQGMPLYLEAAHDGLVPMYERYAFKSLGKLDTMTMMVRV